MSAEYNYIRTTGVITIDTEQLLSDVESEWITALGTGLDTDASTPQGTLIQNETLARTSVMKNNAELGSVINPTYSYGKFLDAICALLGIERGKSTNTLGDSCLAVGTNGTFVPAGSRVRTPDGDIFVTMTDMTFTSVITQIQVKVKSQELGAIPLPLNTSLVIVDGVIGWASISTTANTNVTLGALELTDPALKANRNKRLFQQGIGSLGAIYSRLLALDGVTSLNAIENTTGATGTVKGITFTTTNGVWVCVDGTASDQDIASTLWLAHMGGQPWDFGSTLQGTSVNPPNGISIVDPWSKASYYVRFNRPINYDVYVDIQIVQGTAVATSDDIKQIIMDYANGQLNGEQGLVVGASASAFELAGAVVSQFPGLYVKSCSVAGVAKGAAAPSFPGAYGAEWIANPYDKGTILRGFINVRYA